MKFPDPRAAGEEGLLCIGGDLSVPTLTEAYMRGIFPWPQEGYPLLWFSPPKRGVIDFEEVRFPKSLLREERKTELRFSFNQAFEQVIRACASAPRAHEAGTWILPEMIPAYIKFHSAGFAHSIEAWRGTKLVGGLYGVYVGGVFSGESMFYTESNASKLCLLKVISHLRKKGLSWMDTQMVTPLVETFGGKYIGRDEFLLRVKMAKTEHPRTIFGSGEQVDGAKI